MTHQTALVTLLLAASALSTPTRLWAVQRKGLNFYTRIGGHQLEMDRPLLMPSRDNELPLERPFDLGAGMHYQKGGLHLQVGPTYDLSAPGLLLEQKVNMEGQIGVRW